MIQGHTSACAAMPIRPCATPLADLHASRTLYRSQISMTSGIYHAFVRIGRGFIAQGLGV